ncbi:hypothetical protein [Arthrobacter burdickii]|uniref:Uncharacterized protein n=1 Tax=Arthrobacter burdickii TaxID=3035920 RepID=A0ABT8JWQ4_9MICC|nr:hypothetical protein [Arthrobacter burdickii]MDN4609609.1 hypothetical protein [Arthrobacter burdickii]
MGKEPLIPLLRIARGESKLNLSLNVVEAFGAESEVLVAQPPVSDPFVDPNCAG